METTSLLSHYTAEQIAYIQERKERIDQWDRAGDLPSEVDLIDKGEGSFNGCIGGLLMLHREIANHAWFAEQDLATFKLHSYIVAKLMYIRAKTEGIHEVLPEPSWFYPLLSDYEPIIGWAMSFELESNFYKRRAANPNQHTYHWYQMTLALNGRWEELTTRAEIFLQAPPSAMKKFAPDMRFYLALARQDKSGMESALAELTSPKVAKVRNDVFELTVASKFVSPFACVYAKVASRHGYTLDIDTVLIPKPWLPVSPLSVYADPYDFMRKWTIS